MADMTFEFKPASEIEVGDVLYIPGSELHEDLRGLTAEVQVDRLENAADGFIDVYEPGRDDRIWFKPEEHVRVVSPDHLQQ